LKKLISFLAIGMFLSIPFIANAALLGTGQLNVLWSTPTSGGNPNYYADYDGTVVNSDFEYTTNLEEIFCVSEEDANRVEDDVSFYTITIDLGQALFAKLSQAAWIADHWESYLYLEPTSDLDKLKGEAQKAVWEVTNVVDRVGLDGIDRFIANDAAKHIGYSTSNWYYANSAEYQDYLTPTAPVPEPATMLLLGAGLIGIAGLGRKKLFKK
jgi:hypothetical protein